MTNIEIIRIKLTTQIPINQLHATGLRGSIASLALLKNRSEFHQHSPSGLVYRHPRIQYHVLNGQFQLAGIADGAFLLKAFPDLEQLIVYGQIYYIKPEVKTESNLIGVSEKMIRYHIITPWLPLNRDSFQAYLKLNDHHKKKLLLQKKLIGNLLSFSKSIQYEVKQEIKVNLNSYETGRCFTNDIKTGLLGFLGTFETNFQLTADGWGIGKWAGRGYGIMKLVEE